LTTLPVLRRTLAVFRSAELGFLGFVMPTLRHTPLSSGARAVDIAGDVCLRARCGLRHPLATWLSVASTEGVLLNWRAGAREAAARQGAGMARVVLLEMRGRQTAGVRRRRSMVAGGCGGGWEVGRVRWGAVRESGFLEVSRGLGFSELDGVTWLKRPQALRLLIMKFNAMGE